MKNIIKKIIIKLIFPIIKRLGYVKSEDNFLKNNLLKQMFENLEKIGFKPKHIIDIGANHGTWTREVLKYVPNAYFTLIEPQNWLKKSFQDLLENNNKITYLPVGAGKEKGSFLFTIVDRDDSCTFGISKEEAEKNGYKQIEIPVITLNELVKSNQDKPFPDLVKIDAEGLDLEVLQGASELFGFTEVFMVEAAVYSKSFENNLQKVINFMEERGYTLFDITDLNRPFSLRVLWLVELVFIKKNGYINNSNIEM
jgi:FkbM family methyltransferase